MSKLFSVLTWFAADSSEVPATDNKFLLKHRSCRIFIYLLPSAGDILWIILSFELQVKSFISLFCKVC